MKNWSVRTRIIAAFTAVIGIMVLIAIASFFELRSIDRDAATINADVMPGITAAESELRQTRDILPKLIAEVLAPVTERITAGRETERELADLGLSDSTYRRSMTTPADTVLFAAVGAHRKALMDKYRELKGDGALSALELETLRPVLENYADWVDSLAAHKRENGVRAGDAINAAGDNATRNMAIALAAAIVLAIIAAWLLVRDFTWLIGEVQRSGIQVNSSSTEIAATAKEQQATATEIAATTSEVGATASRISATSKELAHTMNALAGVAEQTASLATNGQSGLQRMESTMRQIMDASGSISSRLAMLSEKAGNINSVVTTINKVADQTNLLSLNAAIEAEKAGEHGRGFTVVATEIRRLADQTAVATYDIEQIVKEMQSAVSAGVMGMDKFSEEVRRGSEAVGQVTVQLTEIIQQVQTLIPSFESVNEGVQSQSVSAQQISEALAQLSDAAQQTAESLRQSNSAIEQLNDAARGLQGGIARFTPSH